MSTNLIPASVLAEAFAIARTEFGVASESDLKISRTSAKGNVTTRTELGLIMSGNKIEREFHAKHKAIEFWAKSKVGLIAGELLRVFPKLAKEIEARNAAVNTVIADNPDLGDKLRLINTVNPSKLDVMAMFALAQGLPGADKGEKAKLLAAGQAINAYELRVQELALELLQAETAAA